MKMCNVTKNGNVGILAKKEILCASIQRKYKLRNEPNKHERKELQKQESSDNYWNYYKQYYNRKANKSLLNV